MATLKQRLHRKNATGYDVIHFETESSLVLRPSGRTVEQDLEDYLPKVQDNDTVPDSLGFGSLLTNQTRPYIGMKEKPAGILTEDDNVLGYEEEGDIELPPYESNADYLGGKPASDYMLKSDYTPVDLSAYLQASVADTKYAPITHTHTTAQVTGLDGALAGKASSVHTHDASQVTAGTLSGSVVANATGVANLGTKQVRNIYAGTTDIGAGAALPAGDIYLVYE